MCGMIFQIIRQSLETGNVYRDKDTILPVSEENHLELWEIACAKSKLDKSSVFSIGLFQDDDGDDFTSPLLESKLFYNGKKTNSRYLHEISPL